MSGTRSDFQRDLARLRVELAQAKVEKPSL
jgi:hypothetical protein